MNHTELKKLHDPMQDIYDRSLIASSSPKNYLPVAIGEFAKELTINPLLENIRLDIAKTGKEAFNSLRKLKLATLEELEQALQLLYSYKEIIPGFDLILGEYEQVKKRCPANSNEIIKALVHIIKRTLCSILGHPKKDQITLEKLVRTDDKNNIIEYIFAPSYCLLLQETEILERNNKTSIYQSCHYLIQLYLFYDVKTRQNKILGFMHDNHQSAVHYLNSLATNFDQILEASNATVAAKLGFDIEECKIHMHRIWKWIKPKLFEASKKVYASTQSKAIVKSSFNYKYSEKNGYREGIFSDANEIKEELFGMSAALLNFMLRKKKPVHKDELADQIGEHTSKTLPTEQVRNAIRTINNKLKKYFPENVIISSKDGFWSINPLYNQYIKLKK